MIQAEHEMKEKQTRLREQNRFYDSMADSVRPQLEKIQQLLDGLTPEAPDFVRRLGSACVLNAYIKRHSNLMLLAEKTTVDAAELGLCIHESMDYLTACGVLCSFQQSGAGHIPLQLLCRAYETFEDAVESALPELRALLIRLSLGDGIWTLRIVMDGTAAVPGAAEQDGTLYLTVRMKEGT